MSGVPNHPVCPSSILGCNRYRISNPYRERCLLHRAGDARIIPAGDLCSNTSYEDLAILVAKTGAVNRDLSSYGSFRGCSKGFTLSPVREIWTRAVSGSFELI